MYHLSKLLLMFHLFNSLLIPHFISHDTVDAVLSAHSYVMDCPLEDL